MRLKPGAKIAGLKPEMTFALQVMEPIFRKFAGCEMVVTEGTGGKHMVGSRHYDGYAVDIRSRDIDGNLIPLVLDRLKNKLGDEYDCLFETNHFHVELSEIPAVNSDNGNGDSFVRGEE